MRSFKIVGREQNLSRMSPVNFEGPVVRLNQPALANGRDRLKVCQIGGTPIELQPPDSGTHGPAANEHHLPIIVHQGDQLLGDRGYPVLIERTVLVSQHAGADFYDDRSRTVSNFLPNWIDHKANKMRNEAANGFAVAQWRENHNY